MSGLGTEMLLKVSLQEVMIRWAFYMVERTLWKLRPVIELIEDYLV
jgi:hypothetical protein